MSAAKMEAIGRLVAAEVGIDRAEFKVHLYVSGKKTYRKYGKYTEIAIMESGCLGMIVISICVFIEDGVYYI